MFKQVEYTIGNQKVCREAFMFVYGISRSKLYYMGKEGVSPIRIRYSMTSANGTRIYQFCEKKDNVKIVCFANSSWIGTKRRSSY